MSTFADVPETLTVCLNNPVGAAIATHVVAPKKATSILRKLGTLDPFSQQTKLTL